METSVGFCTQTQLDAIRLILTLRYNNANKTRIPTLGSEDFRFKRNIPISTISKTISDEIERQLQGVDSVAMPMSSGVDSRFILTLLRDIRPDMPVECICLGFNQSDDEHPQAKSVSDYYNCNFRSIVIEDVLKDLPKLIHIVKEPRWNLYGYYVYEQAKRFSSTLMTGDGGDEIFAGYTFRYKNFIGLLKEKEKTPLNMIKAYLASHERDWVPDQHKMFGPAIKFSWDEIYDLFYSYFANNISDLDKVFLADFNGKLKNDFSYVNDKFSEYFGLKIVTPFLTDKIIKMGIELPHEAKYNLEQNIGKIPLRLIIQSKSTLPLENKKQGFGMNTAALWSNHARERFVHFFDNARIIRNGLINRDWVDSAVVRADGGDLRYANKLISVLSLEIWYRLFISEDLKQNESI